MNPPEMNDAGLEARLARLYGLGLAAGLVLLALGLVFRPLLWAGIAALALVPLGAASLTWRAAPGLRVAIALSSLGVLGAVLIGLLLRR